MARAALEADLRSFSRHGGKSMSKSLHLGGRHGITRKEAREIVLETGHGWLYSLLLVPLLMLLMARGFGLGGWLNRHGLRLGVGGW